MQIILNEDAEPELFNEFLGRDPMARGARMRYLAQCGLMILQGKISFQQNTERPMPSEPAIHQQSSSSGSMNYNLENLCSDDDLNEMLGE
ncbi:MAG: hypothetical protein G8345_00790 [Magnetococcales bacterium]|nr:hypothetical protein [Magnetococcales bacterium]NGZ25405.1 hypothetical protein [Magnetococcales bacterium]